MNEIAQVPTEPRDSDAGRLMQAITETSKRPEVNVETMREMMALYKEASAMEAKKAFSAAMARFSAMKKTVGHNRNGGSDSFRFTYADFPTMERAVRPWLADCGLSFSHREDVPQFTSDGKIACIMIYCVISHEMGHSEEWHYPAIPNDANPAKLSPSQMIQQAITYAKRQTLAMALGLATSEDRQDEDSRVTHIISDAQLSTLRDLIAEWNPTDDQRARMLKLCNVDDIEDLPAAKYSAVVSRLKEKIAEAK